MTSIYDVKLHGMSIILAEQKQSESDPICTGYLLHIVSVTLRKRKLGRRPEQTGSTRNKSRFSVKKQTYDLIVFLKAGGHGKPATKRSRG